MTREFHPAARAEFVAGAEIYEAARPGLGRRFRDAVADALDRIEDFPRSDAPGAAGRAARR